MKNTYEKPDIKIKHYQVNTSLMVSQQQVYDAGAIDGTIQYTLGTLNS